MNKLKRYDLVILGAGSAGLTVARVASAFKLKIALVERHRIGGDCLYTGCVPSKALITMARKIYRANSLGKITAGTTVPVVPDFTAIRQAINASQETIAGAADSSKALEELGIDVIMGEYSFADPYMLRSVNGETLHFKKCIIATGSAPRIPAVEGLGTVPYMTSDTVWDASAIPQSLTVIGSGPIGLELGQAFAMLGSSVTIIERSSRLLSRFDPQISLALQKGLEQSGINILFNSQITGVEHSDGKISVRYRQHDKQGQIAAQQLMVAVGRAPVTENLKLDSIGIDKTESGGIAVDKKLRTRHKHIYAIGDCLGPPFFTHWASAQAASAAVHAIFGVATMPLIANVPSATFTTPEIAQVGANEQDLQKYGVNYRKLELPYSNIDKAIAEHEEGFVTILTDKQLRLLGAAIVGENAAELIGYFSLMITRGERISRISGAMQAYPTYTFGLRELAASARLDDYRASVWLKAWLRMRWR